MMAIVERFRQTWARITPVLTAAVSLPSVGGKPLASLDDVYDFLQALEAVFFLSADDLAMIDDVCQRQDSQKEDFQTTEWEPVYLVLEQASRNRAVEGRRPASLADTKDTSGPERAEACARYALGDPSPGNSLPPLPMGERPTFMGLDPDADVNYIEKQLFLDTNSVKFIQGVAKATSPSDADWYKVACYFEQASRARSGWTAPPPQVVDRGDLFAASDATGLLARPAAANGDQAHGWSTMGGAIGPMGDGPPAPATLGLAVTSPAPTTPVPPAWSIPPATLGLAITSPILALAEGTRTITLTLQFAPEAGLDITTLNTAATQSPGPFRFLLSTATGPLEVTPSSGPTFSACDKRWCLSMTLAAGTWIAGARGRRPGGWLAHSVPLAGPPVAAEEGQAGLPVPRAHPARGGAARRRRGPEPADAPERRFGTRPEGAVLSVRAHARRQAQPSRSPRTGLSSKSLDSLSFAIDWLGVPDDLATYYQGYAKFAESQAVTAKFLSSVALGQGQAATRLSKADFEAIPRVHDGGVDSEMPSVALFWKVFLSGHVTTPHATATNTIHLTPPSLPTRAVEPAAGNRALDWGRYWQLELTGIDFQHSIYPFAVQWAALPDSDQKKNGTTINPPYTPRIKRLRAGYTASASLAPIEATPRNRVRPSACTTSSRSATGRSRAPRAMGPWSPASSPPTIWRGSCTSA